MLTNFRVLWLTGRYGAGKTSLAFLCGAKLLAEGYAENVVSNIPCSFASSVDSLSRPAAIVLDESWIYVEGRSDVYAYAGFVRKFNHYLLLPSVFPIHARLSYFSVQRVFNAYTLGIPVWWYRWNLRSKDVKENGYFGILNPKSIFGHYPTDFVAGDDGGISDELAEISKRAGYKGTRREQKVRSVSVAFDEQESSDSADDLQSVADEIEDSANQFTEAAEDMEKVQKAFQRIKRRIG
jgi:hypothetical protein